jgi:hypothetical protein
MEEQRRTFSTPPPGVRKVHTRLRQVAR